jgi:hypothetical protein
MNLMVKEKAPAGGNRQGQGTNLGKVYTPNDTPKQPKISTAYIDNPDREPLYVDLCACCGEVADFSAFLPDHGRVSLCRPCGWVIGISGGNYAEIPY